MDQLRGSASRRFDQAINSSETRQSYWSYHVQLKGSVGKKQLQLMIKSMLLYFQL